MRENLNWRGKNLVFIVFPWCNVPTLLLLKICSWSLYPAKVSIGSYEFGEQIMRQTKQCICVILKLNLKLLVLLLMTTLLLLFRFRCCHCFGFVSAFITLPAHIMKYISVHSLAETLIRFIPVLNASACKTRKGWHI